MEKEQLFVEYKKSIENIDSPHLQQLHFERILEKYANHQVDRAVNYLSGLALVDIINFVKSKEL